MARRAALAELPAGPTAHAGLWLDRYLKDSDAPDAKSQHWDGVLSEIRVPPGYPRFFARWEQALRRAPDTLLAKARVAGRLVVGLGAESVLETAITLHRTYGVPYLPGSALKGLAAAWAHRQLVDPKWKKAKAGQPIGESHRVLFGALESRGAVLFHDALWIPEGDRLPLAPDVLTVHHAEYYGGKDAPPADWDSPNPVAFASAHGRYLLALTGPSAWAEAAFEILEAALTEEGLGAKTATGYGRFEVEREAVARSPEWEEKVRGLNLSFAGTRVPEVLRSLVDFPEERGKAARRMLEILGGSRGLRAHKEKAWVQELLAARGEGGRS